MASITAGADGPYGSAFWADVEVYLRGAVHREAATSPEAVLGLPTPAAFLARYPLTAILAEVSGLLDAQSALLESDNLDEDDAEAHLLYPAGLKPDDRKKLASGCELLEKLVGSSALFGGDHDVSVLLTTVLSASGSSAGCLRRIAASFFKRAAELSFSQEPATASSASGGAAAPASPLAARAAIWDFPGALSSLICLFGDRDTITGERAAAAIVALLIGVEKSPALRAPPASDEQIAILLKGLGSSFDDADEASSAHTLADPSVRVVRLAALLASLAAAADAARKRQAKGADAAGSDVSIAERVISSCVSSGLMRSTVVQAATDYDGDLLTLLAVLEYLPAIASTAAGAKAILDAELVSDKYLLGWSGVGSGEQEEGEGDPFLASPALSTLADLYCSLRRATGKTAVSSAGSAGTSSSGAIDSALATIFERCVPGIFKATAKACSGGQPAETAARAIGACSTFIACDSEALTAFLAPSNSLFAREWLECGVSSTAELRVAALSGVARVFDQAAADAASTAGGALSFPLHLALLDRFGSCCGRDAGEVALAALKKPDAASRLAGYQFMAAVCSLPVSSADGSWNLRRIWGAAGVATYVLDRTTEHDVAGKEAKFAVVEATMKCPGKASLGDFFLTQLRTFYSQGPYYKPVGAARVELAT